MKEIYKNTTKQTRINELNFFKMNGLYETKK